MSVLDRILGLLFPPRETEKAVADATPDALRALLVPKEVSLAPGTLTTLLPYAGLVQAAVIEAKYHDNRRAQALLGNMLAEYLLEFASEEAGLMGALALVPVPLSKERLKDRGYNQTERICAVAYARLSDSFALMPEVLRRVRDTAPQTRLSGTERRKNMQGAFEASPTLDTSYTYIVVDDVFTTGATMEAAVAALTDVGARVFPLALAH